MENSYFGKIPTLEIRTLENSYSGKNPTLDNSYFGNYYIWNSGMTVSKQEKATVAKAGWEQARVGVILGTVKIKVVSLNPNHMDNL